MIFKEVYSLSLINYYHFLGTIQLTIWDPNGTELPGPYLFKNLRVRDFNSKKVLTTTSSTEMEPIQEQFPIPDDDVLENVISVQVHRFKMLSTFSTWYACLNCRKMLTEVSSTNETPKCANCKAIMPIEACPQLASIRVAIPDETTADSLWLTVFTEQLHQLLDEYNKSNQEKQVDLFQSSEAEIGKALLAISCKIAYDNQTNIVKSCEFE